MSTGLSVGLLYNWMVGAITSATYHNKNHHIHYPHFPKPTDPKMSTLTFQ